MLRRSTTPSWTPTVVRTHAVPHVRHTGGRLLYHSPGEAISRDPMRTRATSTGAGPEFPTRAATSIVLGKKRLAGPARL